MIVDCFERSAIPEALRIVREEGEPDKFKRYDRVGWGWHFGNHRDGPLFFVRRIKDGLSIKQIAPTVPKDPTPNTIGARDANEPRT